MSYAFYLCSRINLNDIFSLITSIAAVSVSIVAGFIGLIALSVSIWQGFETRKNYRLSVTPNICIDGEWTGANDILGFSLINKGVGPAIIKSITIEHLGKEFDYLSQTRDFVSFLYENQQDLPNLIIHVLNAGEYLAQGEKFPLIYLVKPYNEHIEIINDTLSGLTVTVIYKSIYGKLYKTDYRKFI